MRTPQGVTLAMTTIFFGKSRGVPRPDAAEFTLLDTMIETDCCARDKGTNDHNNQRLIGLI